MRILKLMKSLAMLIVLLPLWVLLELASITPWIVKNHKAIMLKIIAKMKTSLNASR